MRPGTRLYPTAAPFDHAGTTGGAETVIIHAAQLKGIAANNAQ
jgi:hypothetical protein